MTSNEWSPNRGHGAAPTPAWKPGVPEETLKTGTVQVERKLFVFTLRENARGRFLRITEDVRGRKDTIIIPAPGLADFKQMLDTMLEVSSATPMKSFPPVE